MTRPPFPKAIDSTLRSTFVSCPRKFELNYLHHWKPSEESVHLIAGGAFAKGLEEARRAFYLENATASDAISHGAKELIKAYGDFDCPADSPKSCPAMVSALGDYFAHYGFASDPIQPAVLGGKPAIEFNFAIPISPDLIHPESGDPILYTGRYDLIGERQGQLWAVDEKTTGYLGAQWFKQWTLRSQLTGYVWAGRQYDFDLVGAIIRGVAIKKRSFDHAESIQYRPTWMLERWHAQLIRDVKRMLQCWSDGYFDYSLDHACSDFGGCPFLEVCSSPNPERWLEQDFVQRVLGPASKDIGNSDAKD